jgi:hypothetical protein
MASGTGWRSTFKSHVITKMLLPYGSIAIAATKNKQPSKIGIGQAKGPVIPGAPILDCHTALRAAHSGAVGVAKIPVPQKLGKSLQGFRGMRGRARVWGHRGTAGNSVFLNLFPKSIRDLNSHTAAFGIGEKQGRKKFCH